jgi:MoxR-vWA-beta-propeller ternary system domain bpX0/MoxR-vWA-beta-propeller ternary system domain bpX1
MSSTGYFQACAPYFWQWEERGSVVAIPGGNTVAYSGLLGEIIEKLAPQGLPPFGSLLLAMIATNPDAEQSIALVSKLISEVGESRVESDLQEATEFLNTLRNLPPKYKQANNRMLVFSTIFENCHNSVSVSGVAILAELKSLVGPVVVQRPDVKAALRAFNRDFRTLSLLQNKFPTPESIIAAIASLPQVKEEILLEQTPSPDPIPSKEKDFVDQLAEDPKTFPVGSLVRWLWGGLNIPVHSTLPSQQPLGGISDLTNKGDFDKLLISEFAYDDITFLSRLANNEALYIHREIPPANNDLQRLIVIDSTLKTWGNPRTIAFAVAVAISRHPKTDISCRTFVAGKSAYTETPIENIDQVVAAMQLVDGGLHAAGGLAKFLEDHSNDSKNEVILVTEHSTLKQSALLKLLHENDRNIRYQVLTDTLGNVDVYRRQGSTKTHLQHLQIPLAKLWEKAPTPKASAIDRREMFAASYPLLLRAEGSIRTLILASDGEWFQVNTTRSLLKLHRKSDRIGKGWEMIYRELPFKTDICEIGVVDDQYILLMFNVNEREIFLLNLQTGENRITGFKPFWRSTSWPSFIFVKDRFSFNSGSEQWDIFPDGSLVQAKVGTLLFIEEQRHRSKRKAPDYKGTFHLLKNINSVAITETGQLMFNVHSLKLLGNEEHLKLIPSHDKPSAIVATYDKSANVFAFPDGSFVEVDRVGMITLRSSERIIPTIFIPSVIDSALGVATKKHFAGNQYYYKGADVSELNVIAIGEFYQKYISRFINTIINHGSKTGSR